jgi:glycosyltransferase involved in cell wall biosynthesis
MDKKKDLSFTVIIPSYNEREDIRIAIESAVNQEYPAKEILVVDDSSDNTPDIIKEYKKDGVDFVGGPKMGCCGARNKGMKMANGDVVVLLNADTALPPDFLKKIKKHYDAGADYVLVESEVMNQESKWARYVELLHKYSTKRDSDMDWTEGFSCRRLAAERVGFIPGGDIPVRFCRDWTLGHKLKEEGFKKVIDLSIKVRHKAPPTLPEFLFFREIRGRFAVLIQYYLQDKPLWFLMPKFVIKDIIAILEMLTFVLIIRNSWVISRESDNPIKDFPICILGQYLNLAARIVGEWRGFFVILKYGKKNQNDKATLSEYKRRW